MAMLIISVAFLNPTPELIESTITAFIMRLRHKVERGINLHLIYFYLGETNKFHIIQNSML